MDEDVLATMRHFPHQAWAIEGLARRDETFRSLCADFALAQAALQRWQSSDASVRDQRCAEYEDLIRDLTGEITAALAAVAAAPQGHG